MITYIKKAGRWVVNKIANEPVATITTVVAGGITWLFSHFSFLPPIDDTTRNIVVTGVVTLVGLIVRQFVTPTRKLAAKQPAAPVAPKEPQA